MQRTSMLCFPVIPVWRREKKNNLFWYSFFHAYSDSSPFVRIYHEALQSKLNFCCTLVISVINSCMYVYYTVSSFSVCTILEYLIKYKIKLNWQHTFSLSWKLICMCVWILRRAKRKVSISMVTCYKSSCIVNCNPLELISKHLMPFTSSTTKTLSWTCAPVRFVIIIKVPPATIARPNDHLKTDNMSCTTCFSQRANIMQIYLNE